MRVSKTASRVMPRSRKGRELCKPCFEIRRAKQLYGVDPLEVAIGRSERHDAMVERGGEKDRIVGQQAIARAQRGCDGETAGILDSGFAPSAVKQLVLFCEQLADLPGRQGESTPALRYNPLRPKRCRLAVEVGGESVAHHIGDLLALADRLLACAVVKVLFEKRAELPAHNVRTVS